MVVVQISRREKPIAEQMALLEMLSAATRSASGEHVHSSNRHSNHLLLQQWLALPPVRPIGFLSSKLPPLPCAILLARIYQFTVSIRLILPAFTLSSTHRHIENKITEVY